MDSRPRYDQWQTLLATASHAGPAELRAACTTVMETHASTRERIPSPAINAGVNLSAFTTDFTNTTRVGVYDIGAYEVTADVTAPLAPTGVTVL